MKNLLSDLSREKGILYVGASVTAQKEGFRPELHRLISGELGYEVPMFVSALGGIGSMFGLANYRYSKREYEGKIGLIIFEYSTGDLNIGITPLNIIEEIIFEFLSDLLSLCPNIAVVHNFRSDFRNESDNQIRPVYNKASDIFGIPVFNIYQHVEQMIQVDDSWLNRNYRDHVHTNSVGSTYVALEIQKLLKSTGKSEPTQAGASWRKEEKGLFSRFQYVNICEEISRIPDGELVYEATQQKFPYLEITPDNRLNIKISGDLWGVVMIIGPESCHMNVEISGNIFTIEAFDRNCDYNRSHCFPFIHKLTSDQLVSFFHSKTEMDFSILKRPTSKTSLPRVLRVVGFIGNDLSVKYVR